MRPRSVAILMAVLMGIVWLGAGDPAAARVVHDGRSAPSNPAIEAGGVHPANKASRSIPYSEIGALANEGYWGRPYAVWPWHLIRPVIWHPHPAFDRMMFRSFNRTGLVSAPIWIR